MQRFFLTFCLSCFVFPSALGIADEEASLKIHLLSGSTEYKSEASLKHLSEILSQQYRVEFTSSWVKDGATDLPNVEQIPAADLLVIFARRLKLPEAQMEVIRKHWQSGKPVVGIRTASHAFGKEDNDVLDHQVLGGNYLGHFGKEAVIVKNITEDHPVLVGVGEITSTKMYKAGELAPTATVLQRGTIAEKREVHPVTWVNTYGKARTFYTSLGVPSDFEDEDFQKLITNAIFWTTHKDPADYQREAASENETDIDAPPCQLEDTTDPSQADSDNEPTLEQKLQAESVATLIADATKAGDPRRGAILFHGLRMNCGKCHSVDGGKSPLGPDLATLNKDQPSPAKAEHLVESILSPSRVIKDDYQTWKLALIDGRNLVGFIDGKQGDKILLRDAGSFGKVTKISAADIEIQAKSTVSVMPGGLANQLKSREEFLDLLSYVLAIVAEGPARAKALQPTDAELSPLAEEQIDHASQIASLADLDIAIGKKLYTQYCQNCHGADGNKTINPLARRFSKDKLKFGTDPYAMWKTITYGNGLMLPQAGLLSPQQRYAVVHYIRESFVREPNPSQYFEAKDDYLASVNKTAADDFEKLAPKKLIVAAGMVDGSFGKQMDYGSFLSHSVTFTPFENKDGVLFPDTVTKAMIIALPGDLNVCYDTTNYKVAGVWQGKIANTEKTHHTSYKGSQCLMPGGKVLYKSLVTETDQDLTAWRIGTSKPRDSELAKVKFIGHYLHSGQVLLRYQVAARGVEELPGVDLQQSQTDSPALTRTFRVEAGETPLQCFLVRKIGKQTPAVAISPGSDATLKTDDAGNVWLHIPASKQPLTFTVWFNPTSDSKTKLAAPENALTADFGELTAGGPRQWSVDVTTQGILGTPVAGYAADEITVPYANPWGAWMRLTAVDFFSDGTAAVSTLSGDVWLVRWDASQADSSLADLQWQRFATGLYEPLGLKIVDDKIYVRGRDRITRLHDLNADGEADYYEAFFEEEKVGAGYHAFQFDLQTDKAGNFYYTKSGRKAPHKGGVIRVSADGKRSDTVCSDFRHPNGLGAGGPHDWITVADNPHGKEIYNGVAIALPGSRHGYETSRTLPMLAVLPPTADSSTAGQGWSGDDWGPLSNNLISTSYSRCGAFCIFTQTFDDEGNNQDKYPNGFAVRLPFQLTAGGFRVRPNPVDGQTYILGHKGWDTQAPYDGCLVRLRYTGDPVTMLTGCEATSNGLRLTFGCDLDPTSITKANFLVDREGEKEVTKIAYSGVKQIDARTVDVLLPDIAKEVVAERTTWAEVPDDSGKKIKEAQIGVNWPIRVQLSMKSKAGVQIEQTLYATVNSLPE